MLGWRVLSLMAGLQKHPGCVPLQREMQVIPDIKPVNGSSSPSYSSNGIIWENKGRVA